jgi:1-acyl-sn-glycerol-3-phosphate acyltransferase
MEDWTYETAADLDQTMIERLRGFPREPDMLVFGLRSAATMLIRASLRVYHRLTIQGTENLPREGSFVIVANHASHLDVPCLQASLSLRKIHRTFAAAAQDYFFTSIPRTMLAAVVVNALPFNRKSSSRQSLGLCRQLLENKGNVLIIFPEGTRSVTGEFGEFKPGVGLLLAGTEIPVVPCYLEGAYAAWPKGAWLPRPRPIKLAIGAPRNFSHLTPGKEAALQIAQEVRDAVLSLRRHLPREQ